jgi:hypothetical protein
MNYETRRIFNILLGFFVLTVLHFGSSIIASAAVTTCSDMDGIGMEKVTYIEYATSSTDPMANVGDASPNVKLRGWLYFDATDFVYDAPVLIYNHGHNDERNEPCAIARYFVRKGFVVFAPLRRGHFADGLKSTGIHNDVYTTKCMRSQSQAAGTSTPHLYCNSTYCRNSVACSDPDKKNAVELYYLSSQRLDIGYQILYIKNRVGIGRADKKLANPNKIAIIGHSWGGAAVVFANEQDFGQSVMIDISGAEMSWGQDSEAYWRPDLRASMQNQARPMYFLQPKNGRSLAPTKSLFGIAVDREYRSQASIFPPAPCDEDPCDESVDPEWKQAHENFINWRSQVESWGPTVVDFIDRYPR